MKRPILAFLICMALAVIVVLVPVRPAKAGSDAAKSTLPFSSASSSVLSYTADDADDATSELMARYCRKKGGEVDVREPYFNTNDDNPANWLRLSGKRRFCKFTSPADGSRIHLWLNTMYTEAPTLAALAYYAKEPLGTGCNGNPASCYCSPLGGSDLFGGQWLANHGGSIALHSAWYKNTAYEREAVVIELKSADEIGRMAVAGQFVGELLGELSGVAGVGVNLMDIERHARRRIQERGAESCYWDYAPSFGNGPFRNVICLSVNDAVLHGLPHDYALRDGDILSLDIAVGIDCHVVRQPLGVCAAIAPFNFPAMVPMWFLPFAIVTGNAFVLKPSEQVPLSQRLIVEQVYDHQGNVGQGSTPVLVFDAWEHAFYLQYKNQKVDFIEAMWRVVNWQDVARRYAAAKERTDVLLLAP